MSGQMEDPSLACRATSPRKWRRRNREVCLPRWKEESVYALLHVLLGIRHTKRMRNGGVQFLHVVRVR